MKSNDVDFWVAHLRAHGRAWKLGFELVPPTLPRSCRLRRALEAEAARDDRVRVALDVIGQHRRSRQRDLVTARRSSK
jgi:hypothetical protein